MHNLQITGRGIKLTEPLKAYIDRKVNKVTKLLNTNISIHCEITEQNTRVGVPRLFDIEISLSLPKAYIKVGKSGSNVYQVIDEIETVLKRQVKKHKDKKQKRRKIKFSETMLQF